MDVRTFCCFDNLFFCRIWFTVGNVVADGTGEEVDILLNDTDLASKTLQGKRADILSVYRDASVSYIVETWQQRTDRADGNDAERTFRFPPFP